MRHYRTKSDIKKDLRRLQLERQIALEELKTIKGEFQDHLHPNQWIQMGLKLMSKFWIMLLIKKIIK